MAAVFLYVLLKLRVNRIHFLLGRAFAEIWAGEEACQSVESFWEGLVGDIKVVVGIQQRRKSVVISTILRNEF